MNNFFIILMRRFANRTRNCFYLKQLRGEYGRNFRVNFYVAIYEPPYVYVCIIAAFTAGHGVINLNMSFIASFYDCRNIYLPYFYCVLNNVNNEYYCGMIENGLFMGSGLGEWNMSGGDGFFFSRILITYRADIFMGYSCGNVGKVLFSRRVFGNYTKRIPIVVYLILLPVDLL